MDGVVATIETLLGEALEQVVPGCGVAAPVRPLADLERGDLVFDGCFALGAQLKRAPEALAVELVASLRHESRFEFTPIEGYINIRLRRAEDLGGVWDVAAPEALPARIVVAPRTGAVSRSAFARIAASAIVQAVLARRLGGSPEIVVGVESWGNTVQSPADLERVAAFFDARGVASVVAGERELERVIAQHGTANSMTVWLPPMFFERDEFRTFYSRYFVSRAGCTLCCPPRGWCEGFQEEWGVVPREGRGELGAHLLHLAGARRPDELDPAVAGLAEQGNLPWFLASTISRLRRLGGGSGTGTHPAEALDAVLRRLVVRTATVRYFERAAAARGEIVPWLEVVTDLLRTANRIINAPEYRRSVARGTGDSDTGDSDTGNSDTGDSRITKILSGVRGVVSDTINDNPLFYEIGAP